MQHGSIKKLVVTNFQSYTNATFNFSNFNYIAAPNGSGKSTISSAICLLCLGNPKLLNKDCQLSSFIKFGCQSATIKGYFKLQSNNKKNLLPHSFTIREKEFDNICTIEREITIMNNSTYYINRKKSRICDVAALLSSMHIDVSSMTQFLPQERVSSFAKIKPEDLFKEAMQIMHINIQNSVDQLKSIEDQVGSNVKELDGMRNEVVGRSKIVKSLAVEADNWKVFVEKERLVQLCRLKVSYVEYNCIQSEIESKKNLIKDVIQSISEHKEAIKFAKDEIDSIDKNINAVEMRDKLKMLDLNNQRLLALNEKYYSTIQSINLLEVDLKGMERKKQAQIEEERETREVIENLEEKIKDTKIESTKNIDQEIMKMICKGISVRINFEDDETDVTNIRSLIRFDPELKKCIDYDFKSKSAGNILDFIVNIKNDAKTNLLHEEREMRKKCTLMKEESERHQRKKLNILAVEQKRLEILKNFSNDSYEAVQWLRKNKHNFKNEILEPSILHVRLKNKAYCTEVENSLTNNMLITFICIEKDDFILFTKILKDEMRLKINVMTYSSSTCTPNEKIRNRFNIEGFIIDYIDIRKEYLEAFCLLGQLHNIPVSKGIIDEKIFDMGYVKIISNGRYVERKTSRYDKKDVVVIDSDLKNRNFLNDDGDVKEVHELEDKIIFISKQREELFEEMKIIISSTQRLEGEIEDFYKIKHVYESKMSEINETIKKKKRFEAKVQNLRESLVELRDSKKINEKINEINNKIKQNKLEQDKYFDELKTELKDKEFFSLFDKLYDLRESLKKCNVEKNRLSNEIASLHTIIQEHEKNIDEINNELAKTKSKSKLKKEEVKILRKDTENLIMNGECSLEGIDDTKMCVNQELEKLPSEISALKQTIIELSAEISSINLNKGALKEYREKNKLLEETKYNTQNIESTLNVLKDEEDILRKKTISDINTIIEPINMKFKQLFSKLNSEGEIQFEHQNLKSSKWKLNILVKFRKDEDLQVLSAHRQSGGEKSVSTILFLIAIQSLSKSPFKLLDEINQGMDKVNEKIVNDILADLSVETETQYFVITPKIIEGIEIGKNMKVFIIYKGIDCDLDGYKKKIIG